MDTVFTKKKWILDSSQFVLTLPEFFFKSKRISPTSKKPRHIFFLFKVKIKTPIFIQFYPLYYYYPHLEFRFNGLLRHHYYTINYFYPPLQFFFKTEEYSLFWVFFPYPDNFNDSNNEKNNKKNQTNVRSSVSF